MEGTPLTFHRVESARPAPNVSQNRVWMRIDSPKFIAAAVGGSVLAAGIGQAVHQNHLFNDCMMANGWVPGAAPVASAAPTQVAAFPVAPPPPLIEVVPIAPPAAVAYTYRQPAYDLPGNCLFQCEAG